MSAIIMDGAALAKRIKADIRERMNDHLHIPSLAIIRIGNDPASRIYVSGKIKDCGECGFRSHEFVFSDNISEDELIKKVEYLNRRENVYGIIVQLPLPVGINKHRVISRIDPKKDVDCLHPLNAANNILHQGHGPTPCTPTGIIRLLQEYHIDPAGKRAAVIGRSDIVGIPMTYMLQHANATVTICHSHTVDLPEITHQADILVSATGKQGIITADMVKPGAVVIDVGITRGQNGKLHGDVDFDQVKETAAYITPVPGGIGPMTRAMLMCNLWRAYRDRLF